MTYTIRGIRDALVENPDSLMDAFRVLKFPIVYSKTMAPHRANFLRTKDNTRTCAA